MFDTRLGKMCGTLLGRVPTVVAASLQYVAEIRKGRRDLAYLQTVDDHMLRDIGLTRGDLHREVFEPLWRELRAVLVKHTSPRGSARRLPASQGTTPTIHVPPAHAPSIVPQVIGEPGIADSADASAGAPTDLVR